MSYSQKEENLKRMKKYINRCWQYASSGPENVKSMTPSLATVMKMVELKLDKYPAEEKKFFNVS